MAFGSAPCGAPLALCLWQLTHNVSVKELAHQLGCSSTSLSRYRSGASKPARALAARLERVTGGHVAAVLWDAPPEESRAAS